MYEIRRKVYNKILAWEAAFQILSKMQNRSPFQELLYMRVLYAVNVYRCTRKCMIYIRLTGVLTMRFKKQPKNAFLMQHCVFDTMLHL